MRQRHNRSRQHEKGLTMKTSRIAKTALCLAAAAVLSACAGKSHVKADGTTDNPVFPKPYSVTFNKNQGTFPTADELEQMKPGLSKDDIYKILSRPHYDEGMFGVREWNYLFHFRTPSVPANPDIGSNVEGITTCQYKVLFDKHKYARRKRFFVMKISLKEKSTLYSLLFIIFAFLFGFYISKIINFGKFLGGVVKGVVE